jgi:two-component system NtrC family response regulator
MPTSPAPRDTILLIEDDPSGREVARFNLERAGYAVDCSPGGEEGLARFDAARHAVVITDVKMQGITGMEVLARIKAASPDTPVLVVTAFGNVELAVAAMRAGAWDFLGKPFNRDQLLLTVEKALAARRLQEEVRALRRQSRGVERPLVAASAPMRALLEVADRVAASEATVLITGESGTGKELVARRLHARSPRADGPFVTVNCAAVPAGLLESELFGHVRGAFTGADRDRPGRFREAHGGTLFLDEVAEIPPALQVKLLRVLQERTVDVLGRDRPQAVDVRVLAATNRDLAAEIREGRLREDLYYRLNVVELHVPALRERPDDLEPLVRHFVERAAPGRELAVTAELVAELTRRSWPGNVRELENACERLVVLCRGDTLEVADLPPLSPAPGARPSDEWPPLPPEGLSLVDLEKRVIERALALKGGNVSQTAVYLGVPRHILLYRLEKHGVRRD